MTTPTPEKAAPIPALLPCPFRGDPMRNKLGMICHVESDLCITGKLSFDEAWVDRWNARADRASQDKRAAEAERDRLFAKLDGDGFANSGARAWFREQGAMLPADRARLRGDAS